MAELALSTGRPDIRPGAPFRVGAAATRNDSEIDRAGADDGGSYVLIVNDKRVYLRKSTYNAYEKKKKIKLPIENPSVLRDIRQKINKYRVRNRTFNLSAGERLKK